MAYRFLSAYWKNLICANYLCDPTWLQTKLPEGLLPDLWNGRCYLSLVGFLFDETRVLGIPVPGHTSFEEINLRAYVLRPTQDGYRRGVIFIREIVPRPLIATVANTFYQEHYVTRRMKHNYMQTAQGFEVSYSVFDQNWHHLNIETNGILSELEEGQEAHFILEHYWGYGGKPGKEATEYEVRHPSWKIAELQSYAMQLDFEQLYGGEYAFLNRRDPVSVFFTPGSAVEVFSGNKLRNSFDPVL
ncbi:MAG: DUF2071 domain-containing protein [Chitinophagaceae bacterium]|nr:DUF2071 domain-containing protein [Chitinophagaceae bacterium]